MLSSDVLCSEAQLAHAQSSAPPSSHALREHDDSVAAIGIASAGGTSSEPGAPDHRIRPVRDRARRRLGAHLGATSYRPSHARCAEGRWIADDDRRGGAIRATEPGTSQGSRVVGTVAEPSRAPTRHCTQVRRTPGISCEAPICSGFVCFIPLFGGLVARPPDGSVLHESCNDRPAGVALRARYSSSVEASCRGRQSRACRRRAGLNEPVWTLTTDNSATVRSPTSCEVARMTSVDASTAP